MTKKVVWMTIDSLRPDVLQEILSDLPQIGYAGKVFESGTLFPNMKATAPYTLPSMASAFTGLHPSETGLDGWLIDVYKKFERDTATVFDVAKYAGYKVSFYSAPGRHLFPMFGVDHLEYFTSPAELLELVQGLVQDSVHEVFAYIHLDWLHDRRIDLGLDATRAAYVSMARQLFEEYRDSFALLLKETDVLILASDHGMTIADEPVGVHRESTTGAYLSNKTLNCFAWFRKSSDLSGLVIDPRLCSTADMFPTLSDILDLSMTTSNTIHLLTKRQDETDGTTNNNRVVESLTGGLYQSPKHPNTYAAQTSTWKAIKTNRSLARHKLQETEIYHLPSDPHEVADLSRRPQPPEVQNLLHIVTNREKGITNQGSQGPSEVLQRVLDSRRPLHDPIARDARIQQRRFRRWIRTVRWLRFRRRIHGFLFPSNNL